MTIIELFEQLRVSRLQTMSLRSLVRHCSRRNIRTYHLSSLSCKFLRTLWVNKKSDSYSHRGPLSLIGGVLDVNSESFEDSTVKNIYCKLICSRNAINRPSPSLAMPTPIRFVCRQLKLRISPHHGFPQSSLAARQALPLSPTKTQHAVRLPRSGCHTSITSSSCHCPHFLLRYTAAQ